MLEQRGHASRLRGLQRLLLVGDPRKGERRCDAHEELACGERLRHLESAPDRIRVNAIAPGVVETPLFDSFLTREQLRSLGTLHPLGRNGQPADTTAAILFFADDEASGWITGTVLPVDGGVSAGRN